jgi:hypothetical protein
MHIQSDIQVVIGRNYMRINTSTDELIKLRIGREFVGKLRTLHPIYRSIGSNALRPTRLVL